MNSQITTLAKFRRFKSSFTLNYCNFSYILRITKDKDDLKCRTLYITYNLAMFLKNKYN